MIKRDTAREFESGHRAAAFEPADYMTDCWNRAGYLGFRESFIEEYRPKGGIELSMQTVDRFQRMYFSPLRNLGDWCRRNPPVTIDQPQQVNIAADGGQQINVSKTEDEMKRIKL